MNELTIFENPTFGSVRTTIIDDEPWFVGKDVALALGFKDTVNALKKHVDTEDKKMGCHFTTPSIKDSLGRLQTPMWINESGLYALIFGSKLESAKKFKRWVTSEVLPTLRKTGSYGVSNLTKEDYLKAASIIAKCPNKRLTYTLQVLQQAGFHFDNLL